MSHRIDSIAALEAIYDTPPSEAALVKVTPGLTPAYRAWIEQSRFCVLTTIGPEGTDGSPRGDEGPVCHIADDRTLLMPDWRGNNRVDSLRNIVRDGRVSLLFLVPGSSNLVRVNGTAHLTVAPDALALFRRDDVLPRTVIVIAVAEVYSQCSRAIIRAGLWTTGDASAGLPSAGRMIEDAKAGFDAARYDAEWPARAARTMW